MSGKRVSFPPSGGRSHRSRESVRDSGIGSLSSEYASTGGRPDRMFTAQDYDQRHNVGALQEALERATKNIEYYKNKCTEMDYELSKSHKAKREIEAQRKAQCDRSEQLEQELTLSKEQYRELQADYDVLRDQYSDLRQRYASEIEPVDNPMMSGAGSLPIRTKSKHEHDEKRMKDRMKARINSKEETSSKSSHRSGRERSRAPSTKRNAYIEEVPSSRGNNYMTSSESHRLSMMQAPTYSTIPRTSQPVSSSLYQTTSEFPDGDYHPYPLPNEPRGRRK